MIAVGGEWGTLSEIALARALGRPVVALRSWALDGRERMQGAPGILPADTAAGAVEHLPIALVSGIPARFR